MPGMRITLDAAMRARDVSRPREGPDLRGTTAAGDGAAAGCAVGEAARKQDLARQDPAGDAAGQQTAGHGAAGREAAGRGLAAQDPPVQGHHLDGPGAAPASLPGRRRGKPGKRRRRR